LDDSDDESKEQHVPVAAAAAAAAAAVPSTHSNAGARPTAAAAQSTRSNAGARRAAQLFPQPPFAVVSPEIQTVLGAYYGALTNNCMRNMGLRFIPEVRNSCKCFPNQCGMTHLISTERICIEFITYLRTHWVSGLNVLDGIRACPHSNCKFWPCNQLPSSKQAILSQVARLVAAEHAKSIPTVVADPLMIVRLEVKSEKVCNLSTEKTEMQETNRMLYAVWCLPQYVKLTKAEFLLLFHTDYHAWNTINTVTIRGAKVSASEDEWVQDDVEVELFDTRRDFADFQSAVLGITLSDDIRVIGSRVGVPIVKHTPEVFNEYLGAHWNFASRQKVLGHIVTFNQWLEMHSIYSPIYQLVKSGMSWKNAKKAVKGVKDVPRNVETIDWDVAECVVGCVREEEEEDVVLKKEKMDALRLMTGSTVIAAPCGEKKKYGSGKKCVKVFTPSKAPNFLKAVEKSDTFFLCRHFNGAFEIYIKLAKMLEASDADDISELWSEFRAGPGRASFVTDGRVMFLCISGTIKRMRGFREMFETFPGFIAALQKKQYIVARGMCAVPVVMQKIDTQYTYFPSTPKKWLVEEPKVVDVVDSEDDESDDESDDGCYYDFGSGKSAALVATVEKGDDCGFDFAEVDSNDVIEFEPRYETDSYSLVDELVLYFKK